MKLLNLEQGSPEWIAARLGIPTASAFHKIITEKTMKLSASSDKYLALVIAEWMLGGPVDEQASEFMERGKALEADARAWYEMERGVDVEPAGLLLTDDLRIGCSPDGLVGEDGDLEIKCPKADVHVQYLLGGYAAEYRAQMQGRLWITGRKWCDLVIYNPVLPPVLVRVEREEEYIAALADAVTRFADLVDAAKAKVRAMGAAPRPAIDADRIRAELAAGRDPWLDQVGTESTAAASDMLA